ncbi:hypothetical protein [Butyrivibrio sp. VCB2001]|jgi:hypothetical protein|uniref:hypothetical protein n=1 Tax=Butyrivibrio sp. VCB2001 TaxID=1280667 RepID=UPI00041F0684|nr:hypothetical protein [Butyrivibrio sp. VCB2001]
MPRVNLSLPQDLYDRIEGAAKKENITVNYYIYGMLEEKFSKRTTYDYTVAVGEMIKEAKKMDKEFTLSDLPTFSDVSEILVENDIKESPAQVRARLGKMFNEAVKKGTAKGIERATITKDGEEQLKFYCRAAVYMNKFNELKKKK